MKKNNIIVVLTILNSLYSYCAFGQVNKVYNDIETKNVLYYKVEEIIKMKFGGTTTRYMVSDLSLISKVDLGPNNIRIITPIYKDRKYKVKNYYVETRDLKTTSGKNQEQTNLVKIKIENNIIEVTENSKAEKTSVAVAIDNLTKRRVVPLSNNDRAVALEERNKRSRENRRQRIRVPKTPKTDPFSSALANLTDQENVDDNNKETIPVVVPNLDKDSQKNPELANLAKVKTDNKKVKIPKAPKKEKISIVAPIENPIKTEVVAVVDEENQKDKKDYVLVNVGAVYERVAQKGYKSVYMFREMANGFYFKNQMEKAVKWYEELFAMTKDVEAVYYFRYGDALKKIGKTAEGNAMIEKFNKMVE
ncbi:MAG: hypothetical protein ABI554_07240 [Flavobacterium sp.]